MLFSIILMFLAFQTANWRNSLRSALWKDKEMDKFHLKNLQMMKSSNVTNIFQYISWICQCQTDKRLRYGEALNVMFTWLADLNHPMVDNLVRLENSKNPVQFWIEEDILRNFLKNHLNFALMSTLYCSSSSDEWSLFMHEQCLSSITPCSRSTAVHRECKIRAGFLFMCEIIYHW